MYFFDDHGAFLFEEFCIAIPPYLCIHLISVYWVPPINMRYELLMRGDGNAWTNWIDSSGANEIYLFIKNKYKKPLQFVKIPVIATFTHCARNENLCVCTLCS